MKFFAVVFMAALAMASNDPRCDNCIEAVQKLGMYVSSVPVIDETKERLIKAVCVDDADCAAFLNTQYPNLINVIIQQDRFERTVCTMSTFCNDRTGLTSNSNGFDCNGCLGFIFRMKQLLSNPQAQETLSVSLSGELFCEGPTYHDSVEKCQTFVARHLLALMRSAASMIVEHKTDLCSEITDHEC